MLDELEINIVRQAKVNFIILLIITVFLFSALSYFGVKQATEHIQEDVEIRLNYIQRSMYSRINDAKNLIFGIAATIIEEELTPGNERVDQIINNFDYQDLENKAIPLVGFIVFNKDKKMIASNILSELQTKFEGNGLPQCVENSSGKFFELKVNPIRHSIYKKK